MSILSSASGASAWRGYEYYDNKNVVSFQKISDEEYSGEVAGTAAAPYHVKINLAHIRQSQCDCPHANGTRIICKHMVALYFTVLPDEAAHYLAEVEAYERDEEARIEAHHKELQAYVKRLSKKELQDALYDALIELEETMGRW